jgi:hypothetical protein
VSDDIGAARVRWMSDRLSAQRDEADALLAQLQSETDDPNDPLVATITTPASPPEA